MEKVKIWFVTSAVIEKELFVAQKITLNRAGMKTCTQFECPSEKL